MLELSDCGFDVGSFCVVGNGRDFSCVGDIRSVITGVIFFGTMLFKIMSNRVDVIDNVGDNDIYYYSEVNVNDSNVNYKVEKMRRKPSVMMFVR
ncbi:Hypothetical predicted protein [Octopus vulgaris]|uniref:Uncharacterized protein n=1 Tax=Octopus vulgaris TaxID=6645 RepID=A0AA36BCQ2_OCTVU|nr:Hypothetical predicted protein [Octopus vulgaris]